MPLCPHDWRAMTAALDECLQCGAQRTPPTPYVHLQSGDIIVPDIHGEPTSWTPITTTEQESDD